MKNLLFYLSSAQDFLEGSRGVTKVLSYYKDNTAKAEELWQNLLSEGKKAKEYDEFVRLLDSDGLFIQNETRMTPQERRNMPDVQFDLRVYPMDGRRVAVLKTSYLPTSAF